MPLTDKGDRLGKLLLTNRELLRLVVQHGFRPSDREILTAFRAEYPIMPVPESLDSVPPPTYDILEDLINEIQEQFEH